MMMFNQDEHSKCYCHDNEKNPLVNLIIIGNGETKKITLPTNEIIFFLDGKVHFSSSSQPEIEFCKGNFIFLPVGEQLFYRSDSSSTLLILRLTDNINLCYNFNIRQLFNQIKEEEKPESPFPLEINARLWHYAQGLVDTWQDGLKCKLYLRSEISKLLTMLPIYYSKKDLSRFFYPILSPDSSFSEFVWKNHLKYRTVNEFAVALHMTPQQFTRRFNTVFMQAPYEWMQQQRARIIYEEICQTNKPLKEIAADYGFTDQANFNRFCKAFYEITPGRLRKG